MVHEINRRTALLIAGAGMFASTLSGPNASAVPISRNMPATKFPSALRLRGTNIVCDADPLGQPWKRFGSTVWAAMWTSWNWDNWIKPQIDDAAAVGNAVRLWGSTQAFLTGGITIKTYFDRWEQILDYCATKGLYVLPTGSDLQLDVARVITPTEAAAHYGEWASVLSQYPRVIGVDVMNEAWGLAPSGSYSRDSYEWLVSVLQACANEVRDKSLPVTASFPLFDASLWSWSAAGPSPAGPQFTRYPVEPFFELSDYLDIHIYAHSTPKQVADTYENSWAVGKPMLFGEFGIAGHHPPDVRADYFRMVKRLVTARDDNVGALSWSCYDVNTSDNQSGLYSAPGVLRDEIAKPFSEFPTTR